MSKKQKQLITLIVFKSCTTGNWERKMYELLDKLHFYVSINSNKKEEIRFSWDKEKKERKITACAEI